MREKMGPKDKNQGYIKIYINSMKYIYTWWANKSNETH